MVKKVNAIQANDTSDLAKNADYSTIIDETEKKIPTHDKQITTNDFRKIKATKISNISNDNNNLNTVE